MSFAVSHPWLCWFLVGAALWQARRFLLRRRASARAAKAQRRGKGKQRRSARRPEGVPTPKAAQTPRVTPAPTPEPWPWELPPGCRRCTACLEPGLPAALRVMAREESPEVPGGVQVLCTRCLGPAVSAAAPVWVLPLERMTEALFVRFYAELLTTQAPEALCLAIFGEPCAGAIAGAHRALNSCKLQGSTFDAGQVLATHAASVRDAVAALDEMHGSVISTAMTLATLGSLSTSPGHYLEALDTSADPVVRHLVRVSDALGQAVSELQPLAHPLPN